MRRIAVQQYQAARPGTTLVELLISLALMGMIMLTFSNFVIKSNVTAMSLNMRFMEGSEVHIFLTDIMKDFRQGAKISDNSHEQRLEYTTYDLSGTPLKKIYSLCYYSATPAKTDTTCPASSGSNTLAYLKLSTDGGSTWGSPYRITGFNTYQLTGTPRFLYAAAINNCTDFTDTNGNRVWLSGEGSTYRACAEGTSSPILSSPSEASKVDFQSFVFSTGKGSPEATRTLPTDFFVPIATPRVSSTAAAVAPAAKDPPLVKAFSTNTANSLFGTAFDVRSAVWNPGKRNLIIVGTHSSGSNTMYLSDLLGVLIRSGLTTSTGTIQAYSAAVKEDGKSTLVLGSTDSGATYNIYGFNIDGSAPVSAASTLSLTGIVNSPKGIAYDAATPTDFYVVGTNTSTSALEITQRNASTGALVGSAWALPAAFTGSAPPAGLAIDPATGNFLVVRNYVNGSSPNKTIDIYMINRGTGSSSYFSVNIDDLGSTATGTTGNWGLGYDALTNRIFLSDSASDKIYQVVPPQLISPQS